MLELLFLIVGVAVAGFVILYFLVKFLIWLVTIPLQVGFWAVKLTLGLVVGIPLAILGFVVGGVVLPVLAVVVPLVLLVLAIPLLLIGVVFGVLKLAF